MPPKPPSNHRAGRPRRAYSQAARVLLIHKKLMAGATISPATFGPELGVSRRTIERDIALLKETLQEDLQHKELDQGRWGYRLRRPARTWHVDRAEILALAAGARSTEFLSGPYFSTDIRPIIGQLRRSLLPGQQRATERLERKLWISTTGDKRYAHQPEVQKNLGAMVDGLMFEKPVRLIYFSHRRRAAGQVPVEQTVHPLMMVLHRGGVYFGVRFADSRQASEHVPPGVPWLVALDRIVEATFLSHEPCFDYPKDFLPETFFADSFGIFTGGPLFDVELLISTFMAPYVLERHWHRSERFETLPDGRLRVRLRVRGLLDVQDWVLRMGEHVEVVAPEQLRSSVAESLRAACDAYDPSNKH